MGSVVSQVGNRHDYFDYSGRVFKQPQQNNCHLSPHESDVHKRPFVQHQSSRSEEHNEQEEVQMEPPEERTDNATDVHRKLPEKKLNTRSGCGSSRSTCFTEKWFVSQVYANEPRMSTTSEAMRGSVDANLSRRNVVVRLPKRTSKEWFSLSKQQRQSNLWRKPQRSAKSNSSCVVGTGWERSRRQTCARMPDSACRNFKSPD